MSYSDDDYDLPPLTRNIPHSGLGVASCILAFLGGFTFFLTIVVAGIIGMENAQPDEGVIFLVGCGVIFSGMIGLVGAGLAIGGLCQSRRNRTFAVVGLILNGLYMLGLGMLIVIGILQKN